MSSQSVIELKIQPCSRIIRICFFSSEVYFIGFMVILSFAYWILQLSGDGSLLYLLLFILFSNIELYREGKCREAKEEEEKQDKLIGIQYADR